MNRMTILLISIFSTLANANPIRGENERQEMQKMKRLHSQCMGSHKSSSNCHKDIIKACDLPQEDCLKILERMNMKDVLKSQD